MKCLICEKSNEKSVCGASKAVCDDCSNEKRCEECNILKTDSYKYKKNQMYSTCVRCFNKKVKCELCNKEFKKTYFPKHIKKLHLNNYNNENHIENNFTNNIINNNDENHNE